MLSFDSNMGPIDLPPTCLVVFLDETGNQDLTDSAYPLFGLGGCATLVSRYESAIRTPWRMLKRDFFGGLDVPLHAAELREATQEQLEALGRFFGGHQFHRIACILSRETTRPEEYEVYRLLGGTLIHAFEDIIEHYPVTEVAVIIEDCFRYYKQVSRYLTDFKHIGHFPDGRKREIPSRTLHMKKKYSYPGLEVADFVMHAAGGHVNALLKGQDAYNRKDFMAVFKDALPDYLHFQHINDIKKNDPRINYPQPAPVDESE